jgi:hypothetical protein
MTVTPTATRGRRRRAHPGPRLGGRMSLYDYMQSAFPTRQRSLRYSLSARDRRRSCGLRVRTCREPHPQEARAEGCSTAPPEPEGRGFERTRSAARHSLQLRTRSPGDPRVPPGPAPSAAPNAPTARLGRSPGPAPTGMGQGGGGGGGNHPITCPGALWSLVHPGPAAR